VAVGDSRQVDLFAGPVVTVVMVADPASPSHIPLLTSPNSTGGGKVEGSGGGQELRGDPRVGMYCMYVCMYVFIYVGCM
jgi:hypothetical protein